MVPEPPIYIYSFFGCRAMSLYPSLALVAVFLYILESLSSRKDWKKNGKDWQRRRRGCFPTSAYRAYSRCVMVG